MHFSYLILPLLLTLPVGALLLVYLYRRREHADRPLMLLCAAGTLWAVFYGLEFSLMSPQAMMWAVKIQYIGILSAPLAWLLLGLHLNQMLAQRSYRFYLVILIVPVMSLLLVWTNEYHHLYWRAKHIEAIQGVNFFRSEYGPLFWVQLTYNYILNLIGAALMVSSLFSSPAYYLRQRVAVIVALLLPWLANALYVFRIEPLSMVDFTPFTIVLSAAILVLGVFRYRLGDVVPVARDHVLSRMMDGMLVFDYQLRLLDCNEAVLPILNRSAQPISESATSLLAEHPRILSLLETNVEYQEAYLESGNNRIFHVTVEQLQPESSQTSQLVLFRDLTRSRQTQDILSLVIEGTAADLGEDFFPSLISSIGMALGGVFALSGTLTEDCERVETLAVWDKGEMTDNFSYLLDGSPCSKVIESSSCVFRKDVADLFPRDTMLAERQIKAYVGTRLVASDGSLLGVILVLFDHELAEDDQSLSVLQVFAMRAAAELERREAEARLHASESRYRGIIETTRDGVCLLQTDGTIQFVNFPFTNMLGSSSAAIIGANILNVFNGDSVKIQQLLVLEDEVLEFSLTTEQSRGESGAFGKLLWLNVSKSVDISESGEPQGILLLCTDITKQHELQESNREFEIQLQQSQKLESLGLLAGGIAHDFNNLLMPVMGYLDLIERSSSQDSDNREYVNRIREAGNRLVDLCAQMLTYSGKGQLLERTVLINTVITEMKDLIRASVNNDHAIQYELGEEVEAIRSDESQMNQVILNLVINAAESFDEGSAGQITIRTGNSILQKEDLKQLRNGESASPGRYIYLEVEDTGSGISESDQDRLFEPFYTTKFTGRGLGLAVVFGIVRSNSGMLRLRSRLGQGTCFRVYLPASDEQELGLDAVIPVVEETWLGKGELLLVDDEEFVRTVEKQLLVSLGFDVDEAGNAKEAFAKFQAREGCYDACVIDLSMPEINGLQLLEQLKDQNPELKVILTSGFSEQDVSKKITHYKNVIFLQKPFELEQLRQCCQAMGLS